MPTIERTGVSLHYLHIPRQASSSVPGSAPTRKEPPLLLLAGMASDSSSWQPVIEGLTRYRDVLLLDNRCTGRTVPHNAASSRDLMVADVLALLDTLELDKVALLGHSMGGMLAWAVAATAPERMERLITAAALPSVLPARLDLFDTLARLRVPSGDEHWFRLLFHFLFSPAFFADPVTVDAAVAASRAYPHRQGPDAFAHQVRCLHSFAAPVDVASVQCPVMCMTGSHDVLLPPTLLTSYPWPPSSVTLRIIDDAAHALHWEQPERFVTAVADALELA